MSYLQYQLDELAEKGLSFPCTAEQIFEAAEGFVAAKNVSGASRSVGKRFRQTDRRAQDPGIASTQQGKPRPPGPPKIPASPKILIF